MSPVSLVDQEELPGPGAESGGVGMVEEAAMQGTPSIAAAPDVLSSGSMAPPVVGTQTEWDISDSALHALFSAPLRLNPDATILDNRLFLPLHESVTQTGWSLH
jgi:hypothetical protein